MDKSDDNYDKYVISFVIISIIIGIIILYKNSKGNNSSQQSQTCNSVKVKSFVDDLSTYNNYIERDAGYTGGVGGPGQWVNTSLSVKSVARPQTSQNEWALLGTITNQSTSKSSENVGVYAQCNKRGDSKSWGATVEINEDSENYSTALVTTEFDLFGNGGDKNISQKVGLDIHIGKYNQNGNPIQPYAGIAIRSEGNSNVNGGSAILIDPNEGFTGNSWDNAIKLYPNAKITFIPGTYITFNTNSGNFEFYKNNSIVAHF